MIPRAAQDAKKSAARFREALAHRLLHQWFSKTWAMMPVAMATSA